MVELVDGLVVLRLGFLALFLLVQLEVIQFPVLVLLVDLLGNGLGLGQVEHQFVHVHQVAGEGRLDQKVVPDQHGPFLVEHPLAHVGHPDLEQLGLHVVLEEVDVGDDVEHGAFMHPLRKGHHLSRGIYVLVLTGPV